MKGLIFYIGTGEGFKAPAISIQQSLKKEQQVIVDCFDFFQALSLNFTDKMLKRMWRFYLSFPLFFFLLFKVTDIFIIDKLTNWIQNFLFEKKTLHYLKKKSPDFIISTHFISTKILAKTIHQHNLPICFFAYNSDVILSHRAYITPWVKKYFVATEKGYQAMQAQGLPTSKLSICEFPINEKFFKQFESVKKERKKLNLKDKPTLLMVFGGEGISPIYTFIKKLISSPISLQIIVICGKNQHIKNKLKVLKTNYPKADLYIKGFVTNMQDYLYCSDISSGKSGLNAIFESIYMKKPFVTLFSMANEKFAKDYTFEQGFGIPYTSKNKLIKILKTMTTNQNSLKPYQKAFKNINVKFKGNSISREIITETKIFKKTL